MDAGRFFIGGRWTEPRSDETAPILNPATEEVIAHAAVPGPDDIAEAAGAARSAFDDGPWPRMKPAERAEALRRMTEIMRTRKRAIGDLLIAETGATVSLAKTFQAAWPIEAFGMAAGWAESFAWERELPAQRMPPVGGIVAHDPVGVVAAITPFNYPFFAACWKAAPAIAMGNTIVLKPSPWTPLDAYEIARAAEEAEVPPGVVNVVGGGGPEAGAALVAHPMVDMVSFTGSVPVGRTVAAAAAGTIKKTQLELGGKSAAVVLDDADPNQVAMALMGSCMLHAGQGCGCTTRMLVPASAHDTFVNAVAGACAHMKMGDPADPATVLGPLIRDEHRRRVHAMVEAAIEDGATLVCGGRAPAGQPTGFFYEPTVLTGVTNDMTIAREEVFGPVLSVITYRDLDEAVAVANDSPFGLAGSVLSASRERALDVARRLRTGFVGLGTTAPHFDGTWGGYRQSGVGREWRGGLEEYTEAKTIAWPEQI